MNRIVTVAGREAGIARADSDHHGGPKRSPGCHRGSRRRTAEANASRKITRRCRRPQRPYAARLHADRDRLVAELGLRHEARRRRARCGRSDTASVSLLHRVEMGGDRRRSPPGPALTSIWMRSATLKPASLRATWTRRMKSRARPSRSSSASTSVSRTTTPAEPSKLDASRPSLAWKRSSYSPGSMR